MNTATSENKTATIFCPECDREFRATAAQVFGDTAYCPHCQTECCAPMLWVSREEDNEPKQLFGTYATMAEARQAINDALATDWGDNTIVLDDTPTEGGFWKDSGDNDRWFIETV